MQSYQLGQVLYVILRKEPNVYPMQVIEIQNKKTLDGEVTTYMVRAGSDPKKILAINDIDGEIFDSSENAKKTLIDRVSQSISARVEQAVLKAKEWYPSGFEHASDDPLALIKKATLGTEKSPVAKPKNPSGPRAELTALADELREEVEDASLMEVPGPNGTMQKVKIKGVKLPTSLQS